MASQKDIKDRISSVKNIKQITRAMEMVAAARLRKAQERIEILRPYADAIRRMTRQAVEAADTMPDFPILKEHESTDRVGILLVTGDRGLAGPFNSQILRAGTQRGRAIEREEGHDLAWFASGKRGASSLAFRGLNLEDSWSGFTDRPTYSDARNIAQGLIAQYADGKVDRVEVFYNGFESALSQVVRHETLLPLQQAELVGDDEEGSEDGGDEDAHAVEDAEGRDHRRSLWIYEPGPEEILERLAPDYVEISIYRALLESTASEHGARMTAMRSASDNASELLDDLQLAANRQRQADITQELLEIVAGAEALS
jgi:F-type H+-transporting ATPase subunit gamma